MNKVREKLTEMGAEQGGRRLTIRPEGQRSKPETCANFVDGEWVPTAKYAKILGRKTPEERKDEAKAETAAKAEKPAAAPVVKKKAVRRKKKA